MRFFEDCDGVTEARGFFVSGVHCDVKGNHNGKLDLGVIYSPILAMQQVFSPPTISKLHQLLSVRKS